MREGLCSNIKESKRYKIVQFLLEQGACPDQVESVPSTADIVVARDAYICSHPTVLHLATEAGCLELVQLLCHARASPYMRSMSGPLDMVLPGECAIHCAARCQKAAVVEFFFMHEKEQKAKVSRVLEKVMKEAQVPKKRALRVMMPLILSYALPDIQIFTTPTYNDYTSVIATLFGTRYEYPRATVVFAGPLLIE